MIILYIIIILIAIMCEAFFSGSEIAIISLNRIRLRILSEAKDKKALAIQNMLKNPNRLLGTTLVGTNIAVVVASSFCAKLVYDLYGPGSEWLTTVVLSPVVLIFGEFIPKAVFAQGAARVTSFSAPVLRFFWRLFYPVVWFIGNIVDLILWPFGHGVSKTKKSPFVTREEIKYLIKESESEGELDSYERSIIYKIFDFGKKKVKDSMRELKQLVYLPDTAYIEDLLSKASESGYSRFPIRSAQTGRFVGIVNILDVVYEKDKKKLINNYLRPLEYVSDTMDVDNALFLIQSKKQTLALVKDANDKPVGFFTMEDLLEELVGEID